MERIKKVAHLGHATENGEHTLSGVIPLENILGGGVGPLDGAPTINLSVELAQPLAGHRLMEYGDDPRVSTNGHAREQVSASRSRTMYEPDGLNSSSAQLVSHRQHLQGVVERGDRLAYANILIVDGYTLQRENLAAIFAINGTSIPAVAWDLPSLCASLREATPDIVLLNMVTSDVTLLRSLREMCPHAKVIVIGISEDDESEVVACAEAGVAGYHLRTESLDDLLVLISKVFEGESACSPRVSAILLKRLSTLAAQRQPEAKELVLTAREIQILQLLEIGLSNRDIADRLCIALHTVKNHVHSVLSKLGVSTRAEAVAFSRSFRHTD
jgi:DNA-binding NarL/FixJ family response regulator